MGRMRDACVGNNLNENSQIKTVLIWLCVYILQSHSVIEPGDCENKWPYWDWWNIAAINLYWKYGRVYFVQFIIRSNTSIQCVRKNCERCSLARCKINFIANNCIGFLFLCQLQLCSAHFFPSHFHYVQSLNFKTVSSLCLFVCVVFDFLHSLLFC